jgi:hypothetical protein
MGCTSCTKFNPVMKNISSIQSELLKIKDFNDLNCLISKNYKKDSLKQENFQEIFNEMINSTSKNIKLFQTIFEEFNSGLDYKCKDILIFLFSISYHENPSEDFYNILLMEEEIALNRKNSNLSEGSNSNKRLIYRGEMEDALKKLIYYNTQFILEKCKNLFVNCYSDYEKFHESFSERNRETLIIYICNEMDNFQIKHISSISNAKKYFDIFDIKLLFENFNWLCHSDEIRLELDLHATNKI